MVECVVCKSNSTSNSTSINDVTVCNKCILRYGLTDSNGESMEIGFYKNGEYYSIINGNYSENRVCYVNDNKCYILNENENIFIIPVPNSKNPNNPKNLKNK